MGFSILGLGFPNVQLHQRHCQLLLAFMVIAVGMGLGGFLPMIAAVNNWFVRRREHGHRLGRNGQLPGRNHVPVLALGIGLLGWRTIAFGLGALFLTLAFPSRG